MELTDVITIYSEKTPNPESMKFVANKMILPNDSIDFRTNEGLDTCPMAKELFEYDFVKKSDYEWFDIIPQLKKFVQDYLEAEKPIVVIKENMTDEEESEVVIKIKQLLEDHVRPAVEMDGGAIDFKSFEKGVVTVTMKGSCSGCPSSTLTLKAGIENLLKRMIPEVDAVEAEAA